MWIRLKDSALLIYSANDTIYELANEKVTPEYVVRFFAKNLPESLKEKSAVFLIFGKEFFKYILKKD